LGVEGRIEIQIDERNGFAERRSAVEGGRPRIDSQIIGRQTFITVIGHQDGLLKLGR
jgi:hypothetical protein